MDYPSWVTPANLGTYAQDYSFDLNPIILTFSAGDGSTVNLLNGALPGGLRWLQTNKLISIYGAATESSAQISAQFTFRITQPNGAIADRTFSLVLTPLLIAPSWANQPRFLGYQSNAAPSSYLLEATTTTGDYLLYDLPTPSPYATINLRSGLLTCNANAIVSNATLATVVRATDGITGASSNITIDIGIIVSAEPPLWITSAGTLPGTYYGNQFVEYTLQAEDPYASEITYHLSSHSPGFTLRLPTPQPPAASGLLYGTLPNVLEETIYTFTVMATSVNGSTSRTFDMLVNPAVLNADFYWNTASDLGSINDGEYARIAVNAVSDRGLTVVYNVTGGLLPPHLLLGSTNGIIEGFCEYAALNKTYYFDITAYDGYQYITRQFGLSVNKVYSNQFFNAYIPLTGALRDKWDADTSNLRIREPGTVVFDTVTNLPKPPSMNIINGLVTGYATPDQIIEVISPWWHELSLQIGPAANTTVLADGLSTIYRTIEDQQSGSIQVIPDNYVQGDNVYPISIDNIRSALISQYNYVSSGSGSGFVMLANLDYSNGSIAYVTVLDPGYGYLSPPEIVVGGAGTGAVLHAVLGLVGVSVSSSSVGWAVGDTFSIPGYDANDPAILTVTEVNSMTDVVALEITNPGNYSEVGTATPISVTNGTASASLILVWGIVAVDVEVGGTGYDCGITITTAGGEILPPWQTTYFPAIEVGEIPVVTAGLAANILNHETSALWGTPWQPTIMVMQWQGIRWIGSTTFDNNTTTWDGNTTRFEDTESPIETVFDANQEIFDNGTTIFDYQDPLAYDLQQVWGSTLIDAGTTVFDLYSTIFDSLAPRTYSNTRLQKWITTQNRTYSGNNPIW
jgi:hypothetical protein